jgi:hypothetical protein
MPAIIITKDSVAVLSGSVVIIESKDMSLQKTYWYKK